MLGQFGVSGDLALQQVNNKQIFKNHKGQKVSKKGLILQFIESGTLTMPPMFPDGFHCLGIQLPICLIGRRLEMICP